MKVPLIKKAYRHWKRLLMLGGIVVLTQCIGIDGVDQPETGIAGEEVTIVFRPKITPNSAAGVESNVRLVVGFLTPKGWNAGVNTTMSYTSNMGNGTMSRVPAGRTPSESSLEWPAAMMDKAGIGGNLIKDMEWVAFWTDQTYNIGGSSPVININVTIKTKPGPQNMRVQLGYFTASTTLHINSASQWSVIFGDPFEVTDGEGPLIDYTSPQLAAIDPLKNTDNDFITITFDGSIIPTPLDNAQEVFLCATGYTADDTAFEVCGPAETSKMRSIGDRQWQIDLWPRLYFGLPEGQTLQRMEYTFKDITGDSAVVDEGSGMPFVYLFGCE